MEDFNKIIKEVLKKEPTLTSYGLNSGKVFSEDPIKETEFKLSLEWLSRQEITNSINRKMNSYYMKHYVEDYIRQNKIRVEKKYISSGSIIAALIYLNIPYKRIKGTCEVYAAIKLIKEEKKQSDPTQFLKKFVQSLQEDQSRLAKAQTA